MSLNYLEIDKILEELNLNGSILQKVKAVNYEAFTFSFYKPGNPIELFISMDKYCRIHRQSYKYPNLGKTHNLVEFFKAYIVGATVKEAIQLNNNRVIKIEMIKGLDIFYIFIRLWGGFPNIIVTNEKSIILHLHKKSSKKSELPGQIFTPPETRITNKSYVLKEHNKDSYNLFIELEFEKLITNELKIRQESKDILFREKRAKEINRELLKLNNRLNSYSKLEDFKLFADTIISNIHLIKKGDTLLESTNYLTGEKLLIPLEAQLEPYKNSEIYYSRYKKATNGLEIVKTRIENLKQEIESLNSLTYIESTKTNISNKIERPGLFYKSSDWEILIGRNAKENEALLRSYVKGNDMWLHIRDYPGGYVFIKSKKNKTIPLDILIDAGMLALFYSKGKSNESGDVMYTQVKHLRRVKNGKPGQVIPSNDKNLYVTINKEKLEKLKP